MNALHQRLEEVLESPPKKVERLSGGMIGSVYKVVLEDGQRVVAKQSDNSLDVEATMLRYLARKSSLPVPEVLYADADLLVLEFVEGSSHFTPASERHAAELLADLHGVSAPTFGFEQDTLIGSLTQPNEARESWVDFFRDNRLRYMLEVTEGRLPEGLAARVERLCESLGEVLLEPPAPSLVHGDVWAANVLAKGNEVTAFLDPACYYGHPEIELAYIALFGTLGKPFFKHYHALRPIAPDFFETRRHIYALYPLLVHVHYFGGSYVAAVGETLERLGY